MSTTAPDNIRIAVSSTLPNFLISLLQRLRNFVRSARARQAHRLLESGFTRQQAGDYEGARRIYEQALALGPRDARAHYLLGVAHAQTGSYGPALTHLQHALQLNPDLTGAYIDLGNVYRLQSDFNAAEDCFRKAAAMEPGALLPHLFLAKMHTHAGRIVDALAHLRQAHRLAPDRNDILRNLVVTLIEADLYDEALATAETAAQRNPEGYETRFCLGLASHKIHDSLRAVACFEQARAMKDDDPELHLGLGSALQYLGRLDEALASYQRALALKPDFDLAVLHRGLVRLAAGDYLRGWPDYEARLKSTEYGLWPSAFPRWNGAPLAGRTLLIYREQGLGDEIMFASCMPQAIADAGHCIIECEPKLERLFRRSFPAATVYASTPERQIPEGIRGLGIDVEIFAGNLPQLYRRNAADFPRREGYLKADPSSVEHWQARLGQLGDGLKIGISWRGGVHRTRRSVRSIDLEDLLPVLRGTGSKFVNLQYDEAGGELTRLAQRHGVTVTHWPEAVADYDQTAALVCALDLVISVCTSVIHLSGALGRPVWIMAPYSPEWRYGFAGDSMTWYPSARIFRQPAYGEWDAVIARVASELSNLSRG